MRSLYTILALGILLPLQAAAAQIEVTWQNPSGYHDMQSAGTNQTRFEQQVMAAFEREFTKLAAQLPAEQKLNITVTNLDLAGNVEFREANGVMQEIRVVRDMDTPYMALSFVLVDAHGTVLMQGDEAIRGRQAGSGLTRTAQQRRRLGAPNLIEHESIMLESWFNQTFQGS